MVAELVDFPELTDFMDLAELVNFAELAELPEKGSNSWKRIELMEED